MSGDWDCPPTSNRMPEADWSKQQKKNAAASVEGRAVYIRGIPQEWNTGQLHDFFSHQGEIDSVNLLPPRPGQTALAAFINFKTSEDAMNAAQICDNLPVEDRNGTTFHLVCSLKREFGKKVGRVSGFSELSKARQEKRSVYMSGLPVDFSETEIRELVQNHGTIESLNLLPAKRNQSCFVILSSSEDASAVIDQLDGKLIKHKQLSVTFPRPPKRTREPGTVDGTIVEIRGLPRDATTTTVNQAISACGCEAQTVKILRHGSLKHTVVALVYFESEEETTSVAAQLHGYVFSPGHTLEARIRSDINSDSDYQFQPSTANGVSVLMSGMQSCEVSGESKWQQQRVTQAWGVWDNWNSWWPEPQSWESQPTCSHAPDISCFRGSQPAAVWPPLSPLHTTSLPLHSEMEETTHCEFIPAYVRSMATLSAPSSVTETDVTAPQQQWRSSPGWEAEQSLDLVRAPMPLLHDVPRPSVAPHLLAKRQRLTHAGSSEPPDALQCEETAQATFTCWSVDDQDEYGSESLDCKEKFCGGSWSQPSFDTEIGCGRFSFRRDSRR